MRFNRSEKREARSEKSRAGAFTLIEVMIVIVILGLLAGIAAYSIPQYLDRAKRQKARTDISVFVGALDAYYGERGQYPGNQEGLRALAPGYIKALPNDPWGRPYQYVQPGKSGAYDIVSYGADGREGGTGADADITNSDKDVAPPKK
jgi:general secretion pathway protein G